MVSQCNYHTEMKTKLLDEAAADLHRGLVQSYHPCLSICKCAHFTMSASGVIYQRQDRVCITGKLLILPRCEDLQAVAVCEAKKGHRKPG